MKQMHLMKRTGLKETVLTIDAWKRMALAAYDEDGVHAAVYLLDGVVVAYATMLPGVLSRNHTDDTRRWVLRDDNIVPLDDADDTDICVTEFEAVGLTEDERMQICEGSDAAYFAKCKGR